MSYDDIIPISNNDFERDDYEALEEIEEGTQEKIQENIEKSNKYQKVDTSVIKSVPKEDVKDFIEEPPKNTKDLLKPQTNKHTTTIKVIEPSSPPFLYTPLCMKIVTVTISVLIILLLTFFLIKYVRKVLQEKHIYETSELKYGVVLDESQENTEDKEEDNSETKYEVKYESPLEVNVQTTPGVTPEVNSTQSSTVSSSLPSSLSSTVNPEVPVQVSLTGGNVRKRDAKGRFVKS